MGKRSGYIYFIGAGGLPLVKIGYSAKHPDHRLRDLQVGSPVELVRHGYIRGDFAKERELHARFAGYRRRGEWFAVEGDLYFYCLHRLTPWLPLGVTPEEYDAENLELIRNVPVGVPYLRLVPSP